MRIAIFAALAASIAVPVMAQGAVPVDQYTAARQLFYRGLATDGMMDGTYYDEISKDLGGTWIDTSAIPMGNGGQLSEAFADACGRVPIAFTAEAPFTISMQQGGTLPVAWTLTYIGGTSFAFHADTVQHLTRLGLMERMDTARQQALFSLSLANSTSDIYRTSPDVMVFTSTRSFPRILVRCSSSTPVGLPASGGDSAARDALPGVLGKTFDDEFTKGDATDAARREAFITCGTAVFSPLSDADLKIVVESNFNPPPAEMARIAGAYPDLAEGAGQCAQAAEAKGLP